MVMQCHHHPTTRWNRTHKFANKNLPLCLLFFFLCRVRTEKKSSRKRRGRKPKRKCAEATTRMIWCQALSPVVPPAHCAARPCRKSMACSAWVSNTTATGVHAPTLVACRTRAQVLHSHTNSHLLMHACSPTHPPTLIEHSSTQANKQSHPHKHTIIIIIKHSELITQETLKYSF